MATRMLNNLKETRRIYKEHFAHQQDIRFIKNNCIQIPHLGKKIVPAVAKNIEDELDRLYGERRERYFNYKLLEENILLSETPAKYKNEYNEAIEAINAIQDKIDDLYEYFEKLEEEKTDPFIEINKKRNEVDGLAGNIPKYVKELKKLHKLEANAIKAPLDVEYVVLEPPSVLASDVKVEIRKEPLLKPKKGKIAPIPESNLKIIKKNIKELVKEKFKPKTLEECASQKRSQPYYMKKDDILKTIDETPEIKQVMPANYKSLNKEELCKQLFD